MFQRELFRRYFVEVLGGKPTTFPTYSSYLKRIDEAARGLDELIQSRGAAYVRDWGRSSSEGPFKSYPSHARSVLNSYLGFVEAGGEAALAQAVDESASEEPIAEPDTAVFRLEREMQSAVRRDLGSLEAGLEAVDGGSEVPVATGRIDILARDSTGTLVVIELKAGPCPAGAIEQTLGYAQAISEEREERSRAILIASSFSDRQRAAAKRAIGLELKAYSFSMRYQST